MYRMHIESTIRKGLGELFKFFKERVKDIEWNKDLSIIVSEIIIDKENKTLELLHRPQMIFELGKGAYRIEFKTSLALRKRLESYAVIVDLTGEERIIKTGRVPAEQALWTTILGIDSLKCNCPDNIFNTIRALRGLKEISRELARIIDYAGVFDKYSICKHTLYALGLGIGFHGLKTYSKHIDAVWAQIISLGVYYYTTKGKRLSGEARVSLNKYIRELLEKHNLLK